LENSLKTKKFHACGKVWYNGNREKTETEKGDMAMNVALTKQERLKDLQVERDLTLVKFYDVSADYLLGLTESKNHPNPDLAKLHLSDTMIELLKSGAINTRLLFEMAAHRDFVKLLADIEIYVDGIASIIRDIKKAHRQDSTCAPETDFVREL